MVIVLKIYVDVYEENEKENYNTLNDDIYYIREKVYKNVQETVEKINRRIYKLIRNVNRKEQIDIIPSKRVIECVKTNLKLNDDKDKDRNKNRNKYCLIRLLKVFHYKTHQNYIEDIIKENENSKAIYCAFIIEILNNIIKIKNEQAEEQSIYVLTNNEVDAKLLENFKKQYKMIYIVTENIEKLKKLEDRAEENLEMLAVLNNKRKSLARAKYIINFDFNRENINQYNINRTAVLLNLYKRRNKYKKRI